MSDLEMYFKRKTIPPSFYPSLGSSYTDNNNMASWIYNFEKNNLSDLDKYEIQKNQLITELVGQPLNITITLNEYTIDDNGYYNFYINELLDETTISFSIVSGSYITDLSGNVDISGNTDISGNQIVSNNTYDILVGISYDALNSIIKIIPLGPTDLIVGNIIRVEGKEYLSINNYSYFLGFVTNNKPN